MSTVLIDGDKLRQLMSQRNLTQKHLANRSGAVTHYRVCALVKPGSHRVKGTTRVALARALEVPETELEAGMSPAENSLTPAERELLDHYRALPFREKARIALEIAEVLAQVQGNE